MVDIILQKSKIKNILESLILAGTNTKDRNYPTEYTYRGTLYPSVNKKKPAIFLHMMYRVCPNPVVARIRFSYVDHKLKTVINCEVAHMINPDIPESAERITEAIVNELVMNRKGIKRFYTQYSECAEDEYRICIY